MPTLLIDTPAQNDGLIKKIIMPSECYVSWPAAEVNTLLGSCISVCLWDSHRKIGGMNHFMLPDQPVVEVGVRLNQQLRPLSYGLFAMEKLVNDLLAIGGRRKFLQAKVFGGANITGVLKDHHIGQRNMEFVLSLLERDKIKVFAYDLGGTCSRRVRFRTDTGMVKVERVCNANDKVLEQERSYGKKLNQEPLAGEAVFF